MVLKQISKLELTQAQVSFIPEGWKLDKVGKALVIKNNFRKPISQEVRATIPGNFPYYGPTKVQGYISEYEQDGTYALIGEDGDHFLKYSKMRQTQFISGKCTVNNHAHIIDSSDQCDSEWFYIFFKHRNITNFLSRQGAGRFKLNKATLEKLPLLIPPLAEQRKIAKILGTWDKAISTTEQLIDNSKQQKKALMQQLLTGKKRLFDQSGKPFEGEWEEVRLEDIAKYRRGSFPQPYGNPEWEDKVNGYPFIQVYDINKNMKLKPSTKFKISDAAIGKSVFIPKETILVSLQGSIGRVAITQYDAYVDRTVLLFQEFLAPMDKVFFAYVVQELFEIEKTKAPGGTIKTITKDVLSKFKILIPLLEEQQKIALVLTNADQEIELLEQQLADLKQEKKALMQQLLTGKRRVKLGKKDAI